MKPVNSDGTINIGRPYVPVGSVFGSEEVVGSYLYHRGTFAGREL